MYLIDGSIAAQPSWLGHHYMIQEWIKNRLTMRKGQKIKYVFAIFPVKYLSDGKAI
jgi:hypothetical protein